MPRAAPTITLTTPGIHGALGSRATEAAGLLTAIVHLLGDAETHGAGSAAPVPPSARVAGLTLLERAVLTARAAGADQVLIASDDPAPLGGGDSRLPTDLRRLSPDEAAALLQAAPAKDRFLLLAPWTVLDLDSMRAVTTTREGPVPARLAPRNASGNAPDADVWLADGPQSAALLRAFQTGTPPPAPVREIAVPKSGVGYAVRAPGDLREAERRLLAVQQSDTDGWVDRVFNRHISRAFSRLALRTSLTPNQVTLLHIGMGLLAAVLFALGSYGWGVAGAILLQLSVALDCADGEIARLKLLFSTWGGTLDVVGDNVVHAAIFVAIGIAAQRKLGTGLALALGGSAFAGIFLCFGVVGLLTLWQRNRWAAGKPAGYALAPVAANHALMGTAQTSSPPAWLDGLVNQITSRDFTVLVVLAALAGHLEWILWLAAVGAHVFWLGFLALQAYFFRCSVSAPAETSRPAGHPTPDTPHG